MVLDTRAGAAPKGIERRAKQFEITRPGGLEVSHHSGVRVLRRKDRVEKRFFVIVAVSRRRLIDKERSRQAQHIMAATGLHGLGRGKVPGEIGDRKEMFVIGVAARGEGTRARYGFPKKFRGGVVMRFAR